jgi:ankyrin repeat protein
MRSSHSSEPTHKPITIDNDSTGMDTKLLVHRPPSIITSLTALSTVSTSVSPLPTPNLMFAIASDNADAVRAVLEHNDVTPNDDIGPQSALAFALTNDRLAHRVDIVKTLLAYGADPASLRDPSRNPPHIADVERDGLLVSPPPETNLEDMDPATRYYIERANAPRTHRSSALIQRSFF